MHLHRYGQWEDGIAEIVSVFAQLTSTGLVQFRYCRKCNKRQIREIKI